MTTAEQRHEAQQQLNQLLKQSDFLRSMLDSQRIAVAESIAILCKALVTHDPKLARVIGAALVEIETGAFQSPSVDGDRSLLARHIRGSLQQSSAARS